MPATDDRQSILRHCAATGLRTFFVPKGMKGRGYYGRADLPRPVWTGPHPTRRAARAAVLAARIRLKLARAA